MKLFLWLQWNVKSKLVFAVAETVERARQLIIDDYNQVKQIRIECGYYNQNDFDGIGGFTFQEILYSFDPEVFDMNVPDGNFMIM